MKRETIDTRAPKFATQTAILALLAKRGPMRRWEIRDALGKKTDNAVRSLLKHGLVESVLCWNDDAKPGTRARQTAEFIDLIQRSEVRDANHANQA